MLFQTSGLPDISEESENNLRKQVITEDMHITFDKPVALTKKLKPHFAPGTMKRARYADINFDMLGALPVRMAMRIAMSL